MHRMPGVENTQGVKGFFDRWNIYHKIMRRNYLSHRQVYGILRRFLLARFPEKKFSLSDLGCGDAEFMAKALRGTGIGRYTGVDLSDIALILAKKNMQGLPCSKRFVRRDFFKEITGERRADVIWMSLTFHHLRLEQKRKFFVRCRKSLARGGCLICYEPVLREGECRRDYLDRWLRYCGSHWKNLTKKELLLCAKHIRKDDFPEKFSTYARLAKQAGFGTERCLYTSCIGTMKLMVFE
ncbi:MAG TPA: class I SAM-dependent methyltransferase [Candidatus Omnitrophota bacterium]|nr:class I SAM-dependent methyltransferase [Candidatus Omnitrophota bacterium]